MNPTKVTMKLLKAESHIMGDTRIEMELIVMKLYNKLLVSLLYVKKVAME